MLRDLGAGEQVERLNVLLGTLRGANGEERKEEGCNCITTANAITNSNLETVVLFGGLLLIDNQLFFFYNALSFSS